MKSYRQHEDVLFLQLSLEARSNALQQMTDMNEREGLYDASISDEFAEMIVNGYNPDRDFMFLQYEGDNEEKVVAYFKDFS